MLVQQMQLFSIYNNLNNKVQIYLFFIICLFVKIKILISLFYLIFCNNQKTSNKIKTKIDNFLILKVFKINKIIIIIRIIVKKKNKYQNKIKIKF